MSEKIFLIDWCRKQEEIAREVLFITDTLEKCVEKLEELLLEDLVRLKIESAAEKIKSDARCVVVNDNETYSIWSGELDGNFSPSETRLSDWPKFKTIEMNGVKKTIKTQTRPKTRKTRTKKVAAK